MMHDTITNFCLVNDSMLRIENMELTICRVAIRTVENLIAQEKKAVLKMPSKYLHIFST